MNATKNSTVSPLVTVETMGAIDTNTHATFAADQITHLAVYLNVAMAENPAAREAYARIYGETWSPLVALDGHTTITIDEIDEIDLAFARITSGSTTSAPTSAR